MAWNIDKNNSAITMHKGDTGAYWVQLRKKNGESFDSGDVALYTVKQGNVVKMSREFPLDDDEGVGNGRFLIAFRNSDTDKWAAGSYVTEIRVVLNPLREGDEVKDGDTVRTISASKSTITILDVLKEV